MDAKKWVRLAGTSWIDAVRLMGVPERADPGSEKPLAAGRDRRKATAYSV